MGRERGAILRTPEEEEGRERTGVRVLRRSIESRILRNAEFLPDLLFGVPGCGEEVQDRGELFRSSDARRRNHAQPTFTKPPETRTMSASANSWGGVSAKTTPDSIKSRKCSSPVFRPSHLLIRWAIHGSVPHSMLKG